MNALDFLSKILFGAGLATDELVGFLGVVGERRPELKGKADEWIAALQAKVSAPALAALAPLVVKELADIAQGKITPHDHPSDLV